jgi:ankyrin repeat protein
MSEPRQTLPARPNLDWLRKAAKDELDTLRTADPTTRLADAQRAIARRYGFASWRQLKRHVEDAAGPPASPATAFPEASAATFLQLVGAGELDRVKLILERLPALVNIVGPHPFWGGRPQPLHLAIEGNRAEMFDLLLDRGADVNGTNDGYDLWSPLMLCLNRNRVEMQAELLRRGARIGLLEALMLGDDNAVNRMLGTGPLPAITPNGGSLLALARTTFALDRLLALGAATDIADRWGSMPIDALSRLGVAGRPLVAHLIARGVPAAPKEYARLGDLATLKALAGADPSIATHDAVMMAAVDFGHGEIVDWLLAHGGPVNARADAQSRHTALHSAAWNGDLPTVKRLVAAGADVTALDAQYDATAQGWAETSTTVTNNPRCAEVAAFLATVGPLT